jgi:glycosyltransferase involved in cell wall biosynthesis
MTTFNGAKHLSAQLDSFVSQSCLPDELIVCDDGSSDETVDILRQFREIAPFKVEIHVNASNLGFTQNFSKAMALCTGDVVLLSDQDDVWESRKIRTLIDAFAANPGAMLIVHDGKLVDADLGWQGVTKRGQVITGFGDLDSLITGALTAYRREFGHFALPVPNGMVGHDQWLHLLARLTGTRLVIDDVLQLIRRHGANTSGWIASSPTRISRWDVFKSQWNTSVAVSYDDRILINESAERSLVSMLGGRSNGFDADIVAGALRFLRDERSALIARQQLARQGWFGRKYKAIRLLASGGYRHFNGYKSLLRDLAR